MGDPWLRMQTLNEKVKKALELKQERKKDELSCVWRLNLKERWRKETFALMETETETESETELETERLLKWDLE